MSAYRSLDMTEMEFDDYLNYQSLSYYDQAIHQGFDQWSGIAFVESHAAAPPATTYTNGLDDIEHTYTELHKSVDQVVEKLSVHTPPRLDQIREQNRKLIDKLTTLEGAMTDARVVVLGSGSHVSPSASEPELDQVPSAGKRRRVSQYTTPRAASSSIPNTPSVSQIPCQNAYI